MKQEEGSPPPQWEFKREFAINQRMRDVVKVAIAATESELTTLRKKLAKATYGS